MLVLCPNYSNKCVKISFCPNHIIDFVGVYLLPKCMFAILSSSIIYCTYSIPVYVVRFKVRLLNNAKDVKRLLFCKQSILCYRMYHTCGTLGTFGLINPCSIITVCFIKIIQSLEQAGV